MSSITGWPQHSKILSNYVHKVCGKIKIFHKDMAFKDCEVGQIGDETVYIKNHPKYMFTGGAGYARDCFRYYRMNETGN